MAIDEINSEIAKANIDLQNVSDTARLEEYYKKFDTARQNTVNELSRMEKAAADLHAYAEEKSVWRKSLCPSGCMIRKLSAKWKKIPVRSLPPAAKR